MKNIQEIKKALHSLDKYVIEKVKNTDDKKHLCNLMKCFNINLIEKMDDTSLRTGIRDVIILHPTENVDQVLSLLQNHHSAVLQYTYDPLFVCDYVLIKRFVFSLNEMPLHQPKIGNIAFRVKRVKVVKKQFNQIELVEDMETYGTRFVINISQRLNENMLINYISIIIKLKKQPTAILENSTLKQIVNDSLRLGHDQYKNFGDNHVITDEICEIVRINHKVNIGDYCYDKSLIQREGTGGFFETFQAKMLSPSWTKMVSNKNKSVVSRLEQPWLTSGVDETKPKPDYNDVLGVVVTYNHQNSFCVIFTRGNEYVFIIDHFDANNANKIVHSNKMCTLTVIKKTDLIHHLLHRSIKDLQIFTLETKVQFLFQPIITYKVN